MSTKKIPQRQCIGCGEMKSKCFRKAARGKGLERSFKMAIPQEVYETLEKEMEHLG